MRHVLVTFALLLAASAALAQPPVYLPQPDAQATESAFRSDPRLQQSITTEIIGRSAISALALLSERSDVELAVAPEDLATLGERKLTVIAKGCSLTAVLAQIPEALQECHWQVSRGDQPSYQLHRNPNVEATMKQVMENDPVRTRIRAERIARLDEARAALALSAEQLAELEKTDLMMARAMRDPYARTWVEILLSLPPEQARQLRETGRLSVAYADAPPQFQQAVQRMGEWFTDLLLKQDNENSTTLAGMFAWRDYLWDATVTFNDMGTGWGMGLWVELSWTTQDGSERIHDVALHPRYPCQDEGGMRFMRLLQATGTPDNAAPEIVRQLESAGVRADNVRREERHKCAWVEPSDPALLQSIKLGGRNLPELADLQKSVSDQSGLSVVSDYFTKLSGPYVSQEMRAEVPLWRLLYAVGEDHFRGDVQLWRKSGEVLVFHRADWPALSHTEVPESVIEVCRQKMRRQGALTADDLAALAVLLHNRGISSPAWPRDLKGITVYAGNEWALLLYASLSADQRVKAAAPAGLSYADMDSDQQRQVVARAAAGQPVIRDRDAARATFALVERIEVDEYAPVQNIYKQLELRFPNRTDRALIMYRRQG